MRILIRRIAAGVNSSFLRINTARHASDDAQKKASKPAADKTPETKVEEIRKSMYFYP